jgi:hypothetical protein
MKLLWLFVTSFNTMPWFFYIKVILYRKREEVLLVSAAVTFQRETHFIKAFEKLFNNYRLNIIVKYKYH